MAGQHPGGPDRRKPAGLRAHDILRGVDLLCARNDVDPGSIRAAGQGVKGIWLLLAAAADPRIQKVWLDKTPYSLSEALQNTLNTNLYDAVIPGFALHWDLEDLVKLMGDRPVMWTDPTNWMGRVVSAGPPVSVSVGARRSHGSERRTGYRVRPGTDEIT